MDGSMEPQPRLLDLSVFEGMPQESITRLATLFYRSTSPACGKMQLDAIEASLIEGVDVRSAHFDHMLHQLAGAALQAGASLFGHTIRSYREDRVNLATLDNIREMKRMLQLTDREFQQLGLLPPEAAEAQSVPSNSSASTARAPVPSGVSMPSAAPVLPAGGDQHDPNNPASAMADEPLLDLHAYDGLLQASIMKLMAIFYCNNAPGSAVFLIDTLGQILSAPGADPIGVDVLHLLHQLAGSALQAGAVRLGKSARVYRESATDGHRPVTLEDVAILRWIFKISGEEAHTRGLLPAPPS